MEETCSAKCLRPPWLACGLISENNPRAAQPTFCYWGYANSIDGQMFEDKASGKDTNRPQFHACLAYLREEDTLVVPSMDRAARRPHAREAGSGHSEAALTRQPGRTCVVHFTVLMSSRIQLWS